MSAEANIGADVTGDYSETLLRAALAQDFVTCEVDRDTVPSQHRCGGCVVFAQQTKEEVLGTDVVVRQDVVREQSPLRMLRFRSRVLQYALALAVQWDVHRLWDEWLWFGHFPFERLNGYARTLEDCLRDVIIDAEHTEKKVFRTNGRTAARPSLLERQTEYTYRRFRIPLEHAESR